MSPPIIQPQIIPVANRIISEGMGTKRPCSVSSFIYILLNQIIEKLSYNEEKEIIQTDKPLKAQLEQYENLDLFEQITELLGKFRLSIDKKDKSSEIELIGAIKAFLEFHDPSLIIHREPLFEQEDIRFRPDLVVEKNNNIIFIEVKKWITKKAINSVVKQLNRYLEYANVEKIILLTTSITPGLSETIMNQIKKSENLKIIVTESN